MSRASIAQIKVLGLDSFAISQIPDADLQTALDAASDWIDGIIGTQFPPPIVPPYPMDLIECECVRASWTLLTVKGYRPAVNGVDSVKARYDEWVGTINGDGWIWRVARGEVPAKIISGDPNVDADAGASGPSVITETSRGFSERGGIPNRPHTDPFSGD